MMILAAAEPQVGLVFAILGLIIATGIAILFGVRFAILSEREKAFNEKVDDLKAQNTELEKWKINPASTKELDLGDGLLVRIFFPVNKQEDSQSNWKCADVLEKATLMLRDNHLLSREREE